MPDANENAQNDVLAKAGLTADQVIKEFRIFVGYRKGKQV